MKAIDFQLVMFVLSLLLQYKENLRNQGYVITVNSKSSIIF